MLKQHQYIKTITPLLKTNKSIKAALLIGSFGRKAPGPNSDIDLQLWIKPDLVVQTLIQEIAKHLEVKHQIFREQRGKWILFIGEVYQSLEIHLCHELPELDKYFLGSEIIDPADAILFDHTNELLPYLESIIQKKELNRRQLLTKKAEELITNFQIYFASCSEAHARSDGYKFKVLYDHALNSLVRLIYLIESDGKHEYMPPSFLTDYSYPLQLGIEKLGTSHLPDANEHKQKLINLFAPNLIKAIKKFQLSFRHEPILVFLGKIFIRDYYWNFRDLSKFNPCIRRDIIKRSAAPCLLEDDYPVIFLKTHNIQTIIDLRAPREIEEHPYPEHYIKEYEYIKAPFDPWNQSIEFKNTCNTGTNAEIAYQFFMRECKSSIALVCKTITNAAGPVLIHCHAGKDRTGIIATLLHKLSGADQETLAYDYLASEMDTSTDLLQIVLNAINELGGIEAYLASCGLKTSEIQALQQKISHEH